ncbi:hypothetical protein BC936DRAFT_149283 [Jimgerdemannia flammicorona]|uniref:Cleft lip and palate transmembrane protein 1-domain-containing protein n=1 Tax=Jimgerdemannia flammicorona TaxID=994334 RepID=A0A433D158_9FUNG|nr:hypothetical protein BC936DRAFT_149283 [Jimgerdemannia flammicorona]
MEGGNMIVVVFEIGPVIICVRATHSSPLLPQPPSIQMLPQILLNHRLRSVEAMPLAAFLFRTVNTFVDDLFAFVIPMPTLTRLSAFRDDVVFIVLLWQWWVYPKRGVETEVEKEEEKDGKKKID